MSEEGAVVAEKASEMDLVYSRPESLLDVRMHYCPGCGHTTTHKILMEVIDQLDIQEETIGVAPVGCAVLAYEYLNVDMHQAAHGRATAVATGIKAVQPDKYVFTYQGDGDLAAIGTAETIHSANRGENFLIIRKLPELQLISPICWRNYLVLFTLPGKRCTVQTLYAKQRKRLSKHLSIRN